jgi:putative DNA primase/helicase
MIVGKSATGKSSFIEGLKACFGSYATTLSPQYLQEDKYAKASLINKRIVFTTESTPGVWRNTSLLNELISEEETIIRRMYEEPFAYTLHLRFLFAMNELPTIRNKEDGIWRRLEIIRFPDLPLSEIDLTLKEKIRKEKAGIFNWAMQGLRRLRRRGRFQIPESVKHEKEMFWKKQFNTEEFIQKTFIEEQNYRIQAEEVQRKAIEFAKENGQIPISPQQLSEELQNDSRIVKVDSNGKRFYKFKNSM